MTARIYCFANQKGGVAKTTTAVNLGAYVAATGRRVLLVDTDPQSNATTSLGVNPRTLTTSLYDVLIDGRPVQDALTLTEWMNLDLLPSSTDLAGAEVETVDVVAARAILVERSVWERLTGEPADVQAVSPAPTKKPAPAKQAPPKPKPADRPISPSTPCPEREPVRFASFYLNTRPKPSQVLNAAHLGCLGWPGDSIE